MCCQICARSPAWRTGMPLWGPILMRPHTPKGWCVCVCVWWCNGLLTDAAIGQKWHRLWHPVWTYNKHGFVFKLKALRSISVTNGTGLGEQQIWDMFMRYVTHPWSRSHNTLWRRIEVGMSRISRAPFSWMTDEPFSCAPFRNSSTVGRILLWRGGEFLIPCFISFCWSVSSLVPKALCAKATFYLWGWILLWGSSVSEVVCMCKLSKTMRINLLLAHILSVGISSPPATDGEWQGLALQWV